MKFCYSRFHVQIHKPLVHDSQRASIYHQGTEASLLELLRCMTLRGLGFPYSPNTTGWPPLVFPGLAPMEAKYRTPPQMPLAARHWFSQVPTPDPNKLHKTSKSCSRQTTTSTKNIVSRNLNWMDGSMMDDL